MKDSKKLALTKLTDFLSQVVFDSVTVTSVSDAPQIVLSDLDENGSAVIKISKRVLTIEYTQK